MMMHPYLCVRRRRSKAELHCWHARTAAAQQHMQQPPQQQRTAQMHATGLIIMRTMLMLSWKKMRRLSSITSAVLLAGLVWFWATGAGERVDT